MQSGDFRADYSGPVNERGSVSESDKCSAGAVIQDFWKGGSYVKMCGRFFISFFLNFP